MMQSGSYWAYRSAAERPDYDPEPPTVRVLWQKTHTARKPHLCDCCNEEIAPGTRYESVGVIVDGEFTTQKTHARTTPHISGCPKWRARDEAAERQQFEQDREWFFPSPPNPSARGEL